MPVITLGILATICHFIWLQTICEWIINSMQLCIKWGERIPGECLFGRPLMLFCIVLTLLPLIYLFSEKILACDIDLLLFNSLVNPTNVFRRVYCIF